MLGVTDPTYDAVIKNLKNELEKFDKTASKKEIHTVAIPKFKFETDVIDLSPYLKKAGLKTSFTDKANFAGITGKPDLFISKVVHKAVIEVNEEGTEAAAATGVIMAATSIRMPENIIKFIANKPFAFVIRDNKTKLILFGGKIAKL
jgi:serpin B